MLSKHACSVNKSKYCCFLNLLLNFSNVSDEADSCNKNKCMRRTTTYYDHGQEHDLDIYPPTPTLPLEYIQLYVVISIEIQVLFLSKS